MFGWVTCTPCVPFHPPCTFACHHVRVRTANTGIFDWFVYIQCGVVFGSSFHYISIMAHIILSVMVVSVWKATGISGLNRMYSQIGIPFISSVQLLFVVRNISTGFVVADYFYSFFFGIPGNFFDVEVSIGLCIIK